jgi:hypothetical protein
MVWILTVNKAIKSAAIAVTTNIHQEISIRNAKSFSHLFIAHQATGAAITIEIQNVNQSLSIPIKEKLIGNVRN